MTNILPIAFKVWLSRLILQTICRRRRFQGESALVINPGDMGLLCGRLMADGSPVTAAFRANVMFILAVCLGLTIDARDLCIPDTEYVVYPFSP